MANTRHPIDRSTMFTALLDVDPAFPKMESNAGSERVTEALAAWHRSDATDMYRFAARWAKENPA